MTIQDNMKLLKFRSLETCKDLERVIKIITTRKLYCPSYQKLNDPIEGLYRAPVNRLLEIEEEVLNKKLEYGICALSRIDLSKPKEAYKSSPMWEHYSTGFRGCAIEISVPKNEIKKYNYLDGKGFVKVEYLKYSKQVDYIGKLLKKKILTDVDIRQILTSKLDCWEYENEYRYLCKGANQNHNIGEITKVWFFCDGRENSKARKQRCTNKCCKKIIEDLAKKEGIKTETINFNGIAST